MIILPKDDQQQMLTNPNFLVQSPSELHRIIIEIKTVLEGLTTVKKMLIINKDFQPCQYTVH